jgi:Zn-dependent protease
VGLWVAAVLSAAFLFNITLGLFNLLPIFPLDGFNVAVGVLPREMAYSLLRMRQYGMLILLAIIATDMFFGLGLLSRVLRPAGDFLSRIFLGA